MKKIFMTILAAGTLLSCNEALQKNGNAPIIGRSNPIIENGLLTPEILNSFARIGAVAVSPNGTQLVYQVQFVSIEHNRMNPELFIMSTDGSNKRQLTHTTFSESSPQWINGGNKIAFLSNESGSSQIWEMNPDGSGKRQVSDIEGGIRGFQFSPDETKLLFFRHVRTKQSTAERHSDLANATGFVVEDLMYRHWDHWVTGAMQPFVADFSNGKISNAKNLLESTPYQSPLTPFGGIDQFAWSPDSRTLAYTAKKLSGKAYAVSTNSDIYFYDMATGQVRNISEENKGYDKNPQFSPNGQFIAWQSQERDGYESDKSRLFTMNIATGEKNYVTENWDHNTDAFLWNTDNNSFYILSSVAGTIQIYSVDMTERKVEQLTEGRHNFGSLAHAGNNTLIATRASMSKPTEIFAINRTSGEATELSFENKDILAQLRMGKVEERWITTTDGQQMLTWVIYPPDFDPTKQYPALLFCGGGPQNMIGQSWSYRWNFQLMAANGYIVVAPNRRGLPGFGMKWLEQISGDWTGQNMLDYLSAIDTISKEPFVNENRLGATGASYGGFSVFYLAGHHEGRFSAFLSHAGFLNTESFYLETEEMFFANWDIGGAPWDRSNAVAQRTYANSPHRFIDRWDTPIMVTHGVLDYRVLYTQSMMAFNAAQLRGIPSRMLIYPDENHWILRPQNSVLFHREFAKWFDEWLK
ncbi:MAG: S9 family peptidase [Dysgonamonadaceae bacterium]|jgi:dipeptidyl aminopeptidase/acylaminoacyl peptidase|nr:S9 family peptidase [Dysgonamonadaceae bacterium]